MSLPHGERDLIVEETDLSTLLIVDDEENILRSLKRLFRREEYRVITATSGTEALELLNTTPVSVILSDQRMPGMTGSELFLQVKTLYPRTIRLIMSGYTELESITNAINDGAIFKFLLKPWDDDKLLEHIREAMSIYQLKIRNERLNLQLAELNKNLEEKVEEQHRRLLVKMRSLRVSQEILDQIPLAVFGVSDEGIVVEANAVANGLLEPVKAVGMPLDGTLPIEIVKEYYRLMEEDITNGISEIVTLMGARDYRVLMKRFSGNFNISGTVIVGIAQPPSTREI
ncbi:response regulator [Hahella ganghwensis]|uniref:response regulator n=1 Tax=Hahella ganghwensis TaxID=286420 RepID=UPI00037966C7|nr:response regulator [Hahella ganghwensis]